MYILALVFSGVLFNKMDYAVFIVAFSMFWKMSWSMQCYKCEPERITQKTLLCENFDYSAEYITECQFSTMCFKKETYLDIGNGLKTKSIQRGCAKQLLNGDQVINNNRWERVYRIYDVYEEKCDEDSTDREKVTKTVHCYCRGSLCNSTGKMTYSIVLLGAAYMVLLGTNQ